MDNNQDNPSPEHPSLLELELEVIELRHQWEAAKSGQSNLSENERQEILEKYLRSQARFYGRISEGQLRNAFPEAA